MTVQAIVERRSSLGLQRIAITEHVFDVEDLDRIVQITAEIPPDEENVLLGVEMDADARSLDGALVAPTQGIDWVIASFHRFPGTSIWWHDKSFREAKEEKTIYNQWLDWVHKVIAKARPNVLGHLGAMICQLSIVHEFDKSILADFADILQNCRKYGVAIELNEAMRKKISPLQKDTYYRVFQLAKQEKVKIALGSDAHSLSQIGQYAWVREIVGRVGITEKDCIVPEKG